MGRKLKQPRKADRWRPSLPKPPRPQPVVVPPDFPITRLPPGNARGLQEVRKPRSPRKP
jgi:hypothetical protein